MNYKYNQFKQGKKVTCKIEGKKITDAKINIHKNGDVLICQNKKDGYATSNKLGYKYSWRLLYKNQDFEEGNDSVFNLKLEDRTIEDVQEGDLIEDKVGNFHRVLGKAGKAVFLSRAWSKNEGENRYYHCGFTISELKEEGYTLVDETKKEETITIAGHTYSKQEVEERLKDLEEV